MNVLKRKLPLGAVAFLLVLALAAMGLVYGNWSQTLNIGGTVTTASVDAVWKGSNCTEFHGGAWPGIQGEFGGKDVASTTVTTDGTTKLMLSVDNAYPNYAVDCQLEITNTGNMPFVIQGVRFTAEGGDKKDLTNCDPTGVNQITFECDELQLVLVSGVGVQVQPQENGIAGSFRLLVKKAVEMKWNYGFQLELCVSQFDKDLTPTGCFAIGSQ